MNDPEIRNAILERNAKAAGMWSSGGRAYDAISKGVSEGIRHCVMRLDPKTGERILDIATGTGLTARHVARHGAEVTGVDIADGLLDTAAQISQDEGLSVTWQLGDAENLPFEDASFDAATSTFGIMFAPNQDAAAGELARVVRPGGRVSVAAWLPDSTAVELRKVVAPFAPPPPPAPPPFNWGEPVWLKSALGDRFELGHELGELTHRMSDADAAWQEYANGFGPIRTTVDALDDERRGQLKAAFIAWISRYRTDLGIALTYQYLLTVGIRR